MPLSFTINCPDHETASEIADALLGQHLVACANILPAIESRYHWKGRIERTREFPLVLKTSEELGDKVERAVRTLHPYETPPILRDTFRANADYEAWIAAETLSD